MPFEEIGTAKTQFRQMPGLTGLDQNIGFVEEGLKGFAPIRAVKIDYPTSFARIPKAEIEARSSIGREGGKSARSGTFRRFDSNHLGPEIREHSTAKLAVLVGQIDDAKSTEGFHEKFLPWVSAPGRSFIRPGQLSCPMETFDGVPL